MTVSIRCSCGKLLDADEKYRGQPVQCPFCSGVVVVPTAEATWNRADQIKSAADRKSGLVFITVIGVGLLVGGLYVLFSDKRTGLFMMMFGLGGINYADREFKRLPK